MRIGLGYQSRVGKDTFVDIAQEIMAFDVLRFADPVYAVANTLQSIVGESGKNPTLLQRIADLGKDMWGNDVWVNIARDKVTDNCIAVDVRYVNEYDMLRAAGFVMVKITRRCRTIDRDQEHSSERELEGAVWDYHIENDGTVAEYRDRVIAVLDEVKKIYESPSCDSRRAHSRSCSGARGPPHRLHCSRPMGLSRPDDT